MSVCVCLCVHMCPRVCLCLCVHVCSCVCVCVCSCVYVSISVSLLSVSECPHVSMCQCVYYYLIFLSCFLQAKRLDYKNKIASLQETSQDVTKQLKDTWKQLQNAKDEVISLCSTKDGHIHTWTHVGYVHDTYNVDRLHTIEPYIHVQSTYVHTCTYIHVHPYIHTCIILYMHAHIHGYIRSY